MHSFDKTLLAKLGFSDPDRGNPDHDAACRYLWHPDQAVKIARLVVKPPQQMRDGFDFRIGEEMQRRVEVPISKGQDQYKTTIGFLDVVILAQAEVIEKSTQRCVSNQGHLINVEVKANQVSASAIIRQINLYREYVKAEASWVLATLYELRPDEREVLTHEKIRCIRLGPLFRKWMDDQTLFGERAMKPSPEV